MKNIIYLTALIASVFFKIDVAHASGCGGSTQYATRNQISAREVSGKFDCRDVQSGWQLCVFRTEENASVMLMASEMLEEKQLPPQNFSFPVKIETLEAMAWSACDSGDPAPEFEANGIYQRFYFGKVEFSVFTSTETAK